MITARWLTRPVGLFIVLMTIAVAAVGFFVVRADIDKLGRAGQENILWDAVQVEIELMRFQKVLSEFGDTDSPVTVREVNDRFDILWSRVVVFHDGKVGQRLAEYDRQEDTVKRLFATMKANETQVVGLSIGATDTAKRLQLQFQPYANELRNLSRLVLHGQEAANSGRRRALTENANILGFLSAVAVFASGLAIYLFAKESHSYQLLAEKNQELLENAEELSKGKSQFLAMMSHELRTPLNGVLGLLALARQQDMSRHQRRLLEQADRSGQQMNSLLGDILDFSALQDDKLELAQKPFEPQCLARKLSAAIEPQVSREGSRFEISVNENCPKRLVGDHSRLQQSLFHLTLYVLETAGAKKICLNFEYEAGILKAALSFDYSKIGGEWRPDLIMGHPDKSGDGFATEALGPTVSRGLINLMGGTTKLSNASDERIVVLVEIPLPELVTEQLFVRIVAKSYALETICRAALQEDNVRFLDAEDSASPHVIMLDAGGDQEAALVELFSKLYPHAVLVALGNPNNPNDFDDHLEVPIDVETVRGKKFMRFVS